MILKKPSDFNLSYLNHEYY